MATKLQVTELDFDLIKDNLKTYMKNQTEFSDYNFEGSGMSQIIDLLAYNTHYLAMNANFAMNEAFLDSATLRSSVVSHAKGLGYTPRSARAPVAYVDVTLNSSTAVSATLAKGTRFTTKVDGSTFGFVVNEDITTTPTNGVMRFINVPIYEGTLITSRYTVDLNNIEQKFLISDDRGDTTTLKVSVQTSGSDVSTTTYTLATDITQVTSGAKVYFLQESTDGKFEVYFGDGVVGSSISNGNIVQLQYVVTNKDRANGAKSFSTTSVSGETDVTVALLVAALGGAEPESISSIKFNAPLDYSSQGRAVTTQDYKTILPTVYAGTQAVQVWGGEDNDPPIYGQVFLSVRTKSGTNLTQAQKNSIAVDLKKYNIASIRPTFVNPLITKIKLKVDFKFDSKTTTKTVGDLETLIRSTLATYNAGDLLNFDVVFRHSKISGLIDATDTSILSNTTRLTLNQIITPTLNASTQYIIDFNNALYNPHSGHNATLGGITSSTGFTIAGNTNTLYIDDDGNGIIRTYYLVGGQTRTYVDASAGTINYASGKIVLTDLNITSATNTDGTISVDILPASNDVVSVRNQLLEIDLTNTTVSGTVDTVAAGGSSAGTGYTTTQNTY
jgi:hypothetical protein|tara:strand:+ start:2100 stop:3941 length:1842 start_codon:yes stop_codon:yes gene_type:complete